MRVAGSVAQGRLCRATDAVAKAGAPFGRELKGMWIIDPLTGQADVTNVYGPVLGTSTGGLPRERGCTKIWEWRGAGRQHRRPGEISPRWAELTCREWVILRRTG